MTATRVTLGYEVRSGNAVTIPIAHMAVTGMTQASGKTTTLEALISRSGLRALAFVTKRGEGAFEGGRRIAPYFRDRADWQFVTSIIDATLQEKNKFLRPWIMRICRSTNTLRDVQVAIRHALKTAKGINEGVYTQLDAYLDLIVPEIGRIKQSVFLDLVPRGLHVMDVSGFSTPMQMLFVQSALDYVNAHIMDTIVVIPEAWEFIPEGKGSPVKASAIALARKGAALRNFIWIDSQDMAGVDKTLLRACSVWLIGKQREANEIKRSLSNIHAGIATPKPEQIAQLCRGEFFACWDRHAIRTYVQPAWMMPGEAINIATGQKIADSIAASVAYAKGRSTTVDETEARALREENSRLKEEIDRLSSIVRQFTNQTTKEVDRDRDAIGEVRADYPSMDAIYAEVRHRAAADPTVLQLLAHRPEIVVKVERPKIEMDGQTTEGRIAKLLAEGFYDEGRTNSATRTELKRTGPDVNNANIDRVLSKLLKHGFVTLESGSYKAVSGMKVNIVEA